MYEGNAGSTWITAGELGYNTVVASVAASGGGACWRSLPAWLPERQIPALRDAERKMRPVLLGLRFHL